MLQKNKFFAHPIYWEILGHMSEGTGEGMVVKSEKPE